MEKYRDLVLKRCTYADVGFNGSLENIINGIMSNLPNHEDRAFDGGLMFKRYRLASVEQMSNDKGLYVRIVALHQTPMGVVDLQKSSTTLGVDEQSPPANSEWLEEDLFLLVKNNDVIACVTGRKDRVLEHMIWKLGTHSHTIANDFKFKISDVPNQNNLNKIKELGVKRVNFDIYDYLSALKGIPFESNGFIDDVSKNKTTMLRKMFATPDTNEGRKRRSNTTAKVMLSRGKFKKDEMRIDDWLTDIGQTLVDQDDTEYTLILEDESVISTKELKISKRVKVQTHANTICPDKTRAELLQYHSELIRDGLIGV